jgi:predicted lipoprotein
MNKFIISSLALAVSLAFSVNAMAQNLSKHEFKAEKKNIAAVYKSDKEKCESLTGNAKDICKAEAKGKDKVAKAELEAQYKPSKKATYNVGRSGLRGGQGKMRRQSGQRQRRLRERSESSFG